MKFRGIDFSTAYLQQFFVTYIKAALSSVARCPFTHHNLMQAQDLLTPFSENSLVSWTGPGKIFSFASLLQ